jgi:hypothetical protein
MTARRTALPPTFTSSLQKNPATAKAVELSSEAGMTTEIPPPRDYQMGLENESKK